MNLSFEQMSMTQHLGPGFEALVYSANRAIAVRCTDALAELPIDWIMLDDSRRVMECASSRHIDFFMLDIDTAQGTSMLRELSSNEGSRSVVLAITDKPIDPDILELCYKSQFFYPVRPNQIREQLWCSMPLAERLSGMRSPEPTTDLPKEAVEDVEVIVVEPYSEPRGRVVLGVVAALALAFAAAAGRFGSDLFRMQHSLSTAWQERVASGISALGSMWLVEELTRNFSGLERLGPPPAGPLYLIATATLLWLCAKHRRFSGREQCLASLAIR